MERPKSIRWIVNADDFGRSSSINHAVEKAHRDGILTTASLMVNEPALDEAVSIARRNPNLGVGLHIALCCGKAALNSRLSDKGGNFALGPVACGWKIFFSKEFQLAAEKEMEEQFQRFKQTGLKLDHVNGHLNIHLHPAVLKILTRRAEEWGIRHLRVTHDPISIDLKVSEGKAAYRLSHALIYNLLSSRAKEILATKSIRHTDCVFGLLRNDRMDKRFYLSVLPLLKSGTFELYSHPSNDASIHELNALTNDDVKEAVQKYSVQLIRYQDV